MLKLVPGLPKDLPAPVCLVLHISPTAKSLLPALLTRAGKMAAKYGEDDEPMLPGHIYVAPPDFHMIVEESHIRLNRGPRENLSRPAIDPLFRSAANDHDSNVIGVILSGTLDDGTAGLIAVKQAGGIAIVQDPCETVFSGMPFNAIEHAEVDFVLPIEKIAAKIVELCQDRSSSGGNAPSATGSEELPTSYICTECGGPLWESAKGGLIKFTCRVGHVLSVESLFAGQAQNIEKVLWTAVRALRERADFATKLAKRLRQRQIDSSTAARYELEASEANRDAQSIIDVMMKNGEPASSDSEPASSGSAPTS